MKLVITAIVFLAAFAGGGAQAFSLDPPNIHYSITLADSKGNPLIQPTEIVYSVWQGGTIGAIDSGKMLYKERATVKPDKDGKFIHWLGKDQAQKLFGELKGEEFGLDKKLYVQANSTVEGKPKTSRGLLIAIDNAYTAYETNPAFKPKTVKYEPQFKQFSPELVRRGLAILYPDFRIQREDGSFMETTGSKTSGVQELLDYCAEHHVDGYIIGGSVPGGQQVVYHCTESVRVHPAQGFSLETGACSIVFGGNIGSKPGFVIDSCMMVDIHMRGLILYGGSGYALSFNPSNVLPLDSFVGHTIVDSSFHFTSIATGPWGSAVEFKGSINYCTFFVNEINGGKYGVHVDPNAGFSNSRFTCKHVHGQTEVGLMIESGAYNVWEVNYNPDAGDPYPVKTFARNDIWFANLQANSKPGLTIEPPARGNQFHMMGMTNSFDNKADSPTNRIYAAPDAAPGSVQLSVETPAVPASGTSIQNRNPFPVIVMIQDAGSVSRWTLTYINGATDDIKAALFAGQSMTLLPGESLTLFYDGKLPSWRWREGQ